MEPEPSGAEKRPDSDSGPVGCKSRTSAPSMFSHVDHGKTPLTDILPRTRPHGDFVAPKMEPFPVDVTEALVPMNRQASVQRATAETSISLDLDLDGSGAVDVATGVGFFDHMLTHLGKHGLFDLTVRASGDTHVDDHHTVEDVGIVFGSALAEALGDKAGIQRYGSATLPMDESLVTVAVDLSGRPGLVWKATFPTEKIGAFDCQLVEEFWRAVANSAKLTLHVLLHHGANAHHIAEAIFKAAARALRDAVAINPRLANDVPSTKGVL